MNYEKKYREALERAKHLHKDAIDMGESIRAKQCEIIFPELAESEDERIRKSLIDMLKNDEKCYLKEIAWLEKQGNYNRLVEEMKRRKELLSKEKEKAMSDNDKLSLGGRIAILEELLAFNSCNTTDKVEPKILGTGVEHASGVLKECIDKIAPKSAMEAIKEEKVNNANKVEAKDYSSIDPHFFKRTNKVEPKFHEGEWIVFNGLILHIDEVVNGYYRTISIGGICNSYDWDIDNIARLWTIHDVKDGDVLVDKGRPFIFKGFDRFHPGCPVAYCGIDDEDYFIVSSGDGWWTDREVEPATKEQCDLLFQKMKEAGYTFDFEKKELRKIEHSSWNEDDKTMLEYALDMIEWYGGKNEDKSRLVSNWLKSLKERIK